MNSQGGRGSGGRRSNISAAPRTVNTSLPRVVGLVLWAVKVEVGKDTE